MPRLPAFTRKTAGAPPPDASLNAGGSEVATTSPTGPDDGDDQPAICPKCGCVFNDETGEVMSDYGGTPVGGPEAPMDGGGMA